MSLIIVSKEGAIPSEVLIDNALKVNKAGWGLMRQSVKSINVVKGFNRDSLLTNLQKFKGNPYVLHLRCAIGKNDSAIEYCEPHEVVKGLWMAVDGEVKDFNDDNLKQTRIQNFCNEVGDFISTYSTWCAIPGTLEGYITRWLCQDTVAALMRGSTGEITVIKPAMWFEYAGMLLSDEESTPEWLLGAEQRRLAQIQAEKDKPPTPNYYSPGYKGYDYRTDHSSNFDVNYPACNVPGIAKKEPTSKRVAMATGIYRKCEWCPKVTNELYIEPDDKDEVCRECALLNESIGPPLGNSAVETKAFPPAPPNGTSVHHKDLTKCGICNTWLNLFWTYDGAEICGTCYDTAIEAEKAGYIMSWEKALEGEDEDFHGHTL